MKTFFALALISSLSIAAAQLPTLPGVAPATSLAPGGPTFESLPDLTATEAVQLLCSRQITAVDYVEALYERYESGGYACLNPWIAYNMTQVLADAQAIDDKAARGESILPLCGLPLAVKDAIDTVGFPTTCATPAFAELYPSANTPLVQQYLDANGIILGKTNLGELQSGGSTNPTNLEFGITTALNPYNPTRTPAGSSSGSGVVLAARLAPLALCEDTGGSCMGPGVANGVYSLRPTIGCYNFKDGLMPYQLTRDTVGSMARTAQDLVLLDSIVRDSKANSTSFGSVSEPVSCSVNIDPNFSLKGVRLGLPSTFGWQTPGISAELADATNAALDKLRAAGAELVPFDSSLFQILSRTAWTGPPTPPGNLDGATNYEAPTALARWLLLHNYTLSVPEVYAQINRPNLKAASFSTLNASVGSNEDYIRYLQIGRPNITAYHKSMLAQYNLTAFLYPQSAVEASPIDRGQFSVFYNSSGAFVIPGPSYTSFNAQIGGSSGNFPIGLSTNGIPAGLMVAGPPGYDSTVLNLLVQMEKLFGTQPPPPSPALCKGCDSTVSYLGPIAYNGTGQPQVGERWTLFDLKFSGDSCAADLLSYGQAGPVAVGPPQQVIIPTKPVTNVTPISAAG